VGRLAGGVAHDFNNLLTVIGGNAQLVLAAESLPAVIRGEVDEIAQAADRAATLTRQLLAFSRQQVLQPRVLDLNETVRGIGPLLDRLLGEAVTLELRTDEALGAVTADPAQVEQVLLNLVVNARDAMPNGGRLQIETGNVVADADFARLHHPMPPGSYVRLVVRDTGIGMDETTMARAFDPFFTTKALGHGTGMGLSTVYGIVKQSGGFIWMESELGRGTTFTIHLPRTPDAVRPAPPRRAAATARRGSETILVAEDEYLVRAMTRRTLERAGYRVFEAVNGVEALAIARELGDELDLLLTDIVMPEMGGRELAAALRLERPSLSILFMSGYTHERDAHLSAGGAVSNFLHKPFTLDDLRGRVRLLLDQTPTAA
jgi:CheY-like chemotaxis protein